MKENVFVILLVFALVAGAFAQTTNSKYEVTFFGGPPPGQEVWNRPYSVAVEPAGSIFVFAAYDPPILIFNRAGELQQTWGDGWFHDAHSIDIDQEGFLWLTDSDGHMVYKFTRDGMQLMALGKKGMPGDNTSTDAFNGPADVAVAPNGDFFVADGHYNSRIVHFSKDGQFVNIIGGTKGSEPGQFDLLHALAIDSKGRLLALDQQVQVGNARIQVLGQDGTFIEEWTNIGGQQPTGIAIAADDTAYVSDADGNSITILKDGKIIDVIGYLQSRPHNIALDPESGVIYLADPPTSMRARGTSPNPNGRGGFVKTVIKK